MQENWDGGASRSEGDHAINSSRIRICIRVDQGMDRFLCEGPALVHNGQLACQIKMYVCISSSMHVSCGPAGHGSGPQETRKDAKSGDDAGQDGPERGEMVPTLGRRLAEFRGVLLRMKHTSMEATRHRKVGPRQSHELVEVGGACPARLAERCPKIWILKVLTWCDAWWRPTLRNLHAGRPAEPGARPPTRRQAPMGRRDTHHPPARS